MHSQDEQEKDVSAMWVRIYGRRENSAMHPTSEALCYKPLRQN